MHLQPTQKSGFSLLQVALLLSVASIIVVSILPGGGSSTDLGKDAITVQRMQKIEEATRAFMAKNLRRPCPASGTAATHVENCAGANFTNVVTPTATGAAGKVLTVDSVSGVLAGGYVSSTSIVSKTALPEVVSISAPDITLNTNAALGSVAFNSTVAGTVPTRDLGLPDEYALDGYGRRIMYAVDTRATSASRCQDMQKLAHPGDVRIKDTSTDTALADKTMWALMSYGKDGHGAFPANGSDLDKRFDTGAKDPATGLTDPDTASNAFAASGSMDTSTFTGTLIKKEKTTGFDDVVWTMAATKNTCCVGEMCGFGVRVDGAANNHLGYRGVATGDINGDGISDVVFSGTEAGVTGGKVYVVFGKKIGWPAIGTPIDVSSLGTSGFYLHNDNDTDFPKWVVAPPEQGKTMAVGDVNNDGYDDIVTSAGDASFSKILIFYGSADPDNTDLSESSIVQLKLPPSGTSAPPISLADVDGDDKADIVTLINSGGYSVPEAYVIYGNPSDIDLTATATGMGLCADTTGFKIRTSTNTAAAVATVSMKEMGDVNGDGIDDIIISGGHTTANLFVLFGRDKITWDGDKSGAKCVSGTPPVSEAIYADTQAASMGEGMTLKTSNSLGASKPLGAYNIRVADINHDGVKDMFFDYDNGSGFSQYNYIFYGGAFASATYSNYASNYATYGFRIAVNASTPSWVDYSNLAQRSIIGDVNNDSMMDIIFADPTSDLGGVNNLGASFVALQPVNTFKTAYAATTNLFGHIFTTDDTGLPLNNDVTKGFRLDGSPQYHQGIVRAIADINADGKNDIIISAPNYIDTGNMYILWGRNTVPWDASFDVSPLN